MLLLRRRRRWARGFPVGRCYNETLIGWLAVQMASLMDAARRKVSMGPSTCICICPCSPDASIGRTNRPFSGKVPTQTRCVAMAPNIRHSDRRRRFSLVAGARRRDNRV